MTLSAFKKAIAPALLGVTAAIISWVATGSLDLAELGMAGGGLLTAAGVYVVPNVATVPILKALVPGFLSIVAVFSAALERGELSTADLRVALAGVLTSAVVFWVRNGAHYDHVHVAEGLGR